MATFGSHVVCTVKWYTFLAITIAAISSAAPNAWSKGLKTIRQDENESNYDFRDGHGNINPVPFTWT